MESTAVIDIFSKQPIDFSQPVDGSASTYPLNTPENRALTLAQAERFDYICKDIAWGSEDRQSFGWMLRGLVMSLLPENRFHLDLLRNIAACQWQLMRVGAIQNNLFEAGKEKPGKHGLPKGTLEAIGWRPEHSELLEDLQRAVQIYFRVRGPIRK